MKNKTKGLLVLFSLMSLCSCNKELVGNYISYESGPQIVDGVRPSSDDNPFSNFGLYKEPELEIDGEIDEEYLYPSGSGKKEVLKFGNEDTDVYLYKGEHAIYFIFDAKDDSISCLDLEDINITTAQSDSCEIYIDTYGDGGSGRTSTDYEFRVTASGRVYSNVTGFVAKSFLNGTNNYFKDVDVGFRIEGYVSYESLGVGVDKNTPTSFAFARVTKTGNKGYVWHGEVDPQIPNNYEVLHTDNKFYSLDTCPMNGVIKGKVIDIDGNPVEKVIISGADKSTYTDVNGNYELEFKDLTSHLTLGFRKGEYIGYTKEITKSEIRKSNNEVTFDQVLIKTNQKNYQASFKGQVFERDGVTPIKDAVVTINDSITTTNNEGKYEFIANCEGYENIISYHSSTHSKYETLIEIRSIDILGTTTLKDIQLDENLGDELEFGGIDVEKATVRAIRNNDKQTFKLVLKTEANIDPTVYAGSYFEVFIDTLTSSGLNLRDATDYRFDIEYSKQGVLKYENYGGVVINTDSIKTTYGRINELYYVEADFPYELLGVTSNDILGFYFGIKVSYNWDGMYTSGGAYIPAENPQSYYRLGLDSKFYIGTSNN